MHQHMGCTRGNSLQAVPDGIMTFCTAGHGQPGQAEISVRIQPGQLPPAFFQLCGRKDKNDTRHGGAAAESESAVPVQGQPLPEQKLLGGSAGSISHSTAAAGGQQKYPGAETAGRSRVRRNVRLRDGGKSRGGRPASGTGGGGRGAERGSARRVQRVAGHDVPGVKNRGSRPVSRVLSCGMPHEATIPLGVRLPAPSSNLPGRIGRASLLPYLVLLQTGYAEHAVSPRHLVGSYSTVSPLPPQWRFAFCGAVRRSPFLDVIQRPALWSPDFPPRTCVRGGGPSGSRVRTGAENGSRPAICRNFVQRCSRRDGV